jgi:hypothetical protein
MHARQATPSLEYMRACARERERERERERVATLLALSYVDL